MSIEVVYGVVHKNLESHPILFSKLSDFNLLSIKSFRDSVEIYEFKKNKKLSELDVQNLLSSKQDD